MVKFPLKIFIVQTKLIFLAGQINVSKLKSPVEENNEKAEIYSQRIRAGKRTYFFDVKSTRSNDFYLTITESKRKFNNDTYSYEKHKIFLYKEDFAKFLEALQGTIEHVKTNLLSEEDLAELERLEQEEPVAVLDGEGELKWE